MGTILLVSKASYCSRADELKSTLKNKLEINEILYKDKFDSYVTVNCRCM